MVKQFPQLKYIQEITLLLTVPREKLLKKILKNEQIHLLNYCIKNNLLEIDYQLLCEIPVKYNNVNMLDYTYKMGGILSMNVCNLCISYGSMDCLEYIYNQLQGNIDWTEDMCNSAAKNGHLKCLEYIYDKHVDTTCPWNEITCAYAAEKGHIDIINYMLEKECPLDTVACSYAAKGNHLEILKLLHKKGGIPLYLDTCLHAAIHNNMEMLLYAYHNGCKLNPVGIPDKICYYAALNNNLYMLMYAHKLGCTIDGKQVCNIALKNNNKKMINYVLSVV
jgi:hypothetical protein